MPKVTGPLDHTKKLVLYVLLNVNFVDLRASVGSLPSDFSLIQLSNFLLARIIYPSPYLSCYQSINHLLSAHGYSDSGSRSMEKNAIALPTHDHEAFCHIYRCILSNKLDIIFNLRVAYDGGRLGRAITDEEVLQETYTALCRILNLVTFLGIES